MSLAFVDRLAASQAWIDPIAERLQPLIRRAVAPARVRDLLDGVWLGAPLHPALTDVPVGSWTGALLLDGASLVGSGRSLAAAADDALMIGTIGAVPAAVTGLNDLRDLRGQSRRIAMVHALLNLAGVSLATASLVCRRTGRRGLGRGLSGLGYLISASAAHLGGQLSYGLGVRVNRTLGQSAPEAFTAVLDADDLHGDELREVRAGDARLLLARSEDGEICAIASTCTHLGGPLAEGRRHGDTVTCPWHGSCFDLRSGAVVRGPAVFPQPRLSVRVREGKIEVGLPGAESTQLPEVTTLQVSARG